MTRAWRSRSPRPPHSTTALTSRPTCARRHREERRRVASSAVRVRDELSGDEFDIATMSVVNATGVWADDVFTIAEHRTSHRITPAKGVHVSVARERLPADVAAVFSVPDDRRSVFVVPFEDAPYTYVGTTDTAYDGLARRAALHARGRGVSARGRERVDVVEPHADDVTGVWAGLRPLLAPVNGKKLSERTADLSRRHRVTDSHDGVVHITGGKWTTYRQMAQDAVDALAPYVSPPQAGAHEDARAPRRRRVATDATTSRRTSTNASARTRT